MSWQQARNNYLNRHITHVYLQHKFCVSKSVLISEVLWEVCICLSCSMLQCLDDLFYIFTQEWFLTKAKIKSECTKKQPFQGQIVEFTESVCQAHCHSHYTVTVLYCNSTVHFTNLSLYILVYRCTMACTNTHSHMHPQTTLQACHYTREY